MELITKAVDLAYSVQETFTEHPIMATLSALGGLALSKKLASCLKSTYDYTLRRRKDLYKKYGPGWAIITGGTDGIGLSYAKEMAAYGFDVCIIARDSTKLAAKALEIKDYGIKNGFRKVEVKKIVFDFKEKNSPKEYENLGRELSTLKDIGILVNNVGIGSVRGFEDFSLEKLNELVSVNIMSQMMITRLVIPTMLKRAKRTAIIFISSILGDIEMPYFGVYCATKAFTTSLAKNLALEYKREKIDILCVKCARVKTKGFHHEGSAMVVEPQVAVRAQLSHLGHTSQTYGCWQHALTAVGLACASQGDKRKEGETSRDFYMKEEGVVKI